MKVEHCREEMPGKGKFAELTKISASRVKKIMQTNEEVGIGLDQNGSKLHSSFLRWANWLSQCQ